MKLFAFKCKKVLTFGLGSVIIGTVKKRQSEYTYEKGLFPWLYIRGVSTNPQRLSSLGIIFISYFKSSLGLWKVIAKSDEAQFCFALYLLLYKGSDYHNKNGTLLRSAFLMI